MIRRLAVVLALALTTASSAAVAQDEIRIGVPGPVTGAVSFLGQHMRWGSELAAEEINARGGVLGKKLVIRMEDTKCNPAEAVGAAERLLNREQVAVLTGDICSSATLALMPVVERAQVPMVVAISTHPGITEKAGAGGNRWVFRTNPTDIAMARAMGAHIARKGARSVAFLVEDTDYGRTGMEILRKELEAKGIQTVSADVFKQKETDFLPVLTRLKGVKVDRLVVYALDQDLVNIMKQYRQLGLKVPLTGRPALVSGLVREMLGSFEGSSTIYPYYAGYEGARNREFVARFSQKNREEPHYVAFANYEAVQLIAEAIKAAGSTKPEALRDAIGKIRFTSMLGTVAFDDHHQAHNKALILEVKDGKLVVVELLDT
jgi:branched-chain amino acid transport system substrate-binding protein